MQPDFSLAGKVTLTLTRVEEVLISAIASASAWDKQCCVFVIRVGCAGDAAALCTTKNASLS